MDTTPDLNLLKDTIAYYTRNNATKKFLDSYLQQEISRYTVQLKEEIDNDIAGLVMLSFWQRLHSNAGKQNLSYLISLCEQVDQKEENIFARVNPIFHKVYDIDSFHYVSKQYSEAIRKHIDNELTIFNRALDVVINLHHPTYEQLLTSIFTKNYFMDLANHEGMLLLLGSDYTIALHRLSAELSRTNMESPSLNTSSTTVFSNIMRKANANFVYHYLLVKEKDAKKLF